MVLWAPTAISTKARRYEKNSEQHSIHSQARPLGQELNQKKQAATTAHAKFALGSGFFYTAVQSRYFPTTQPAKATMAIVKTPALLLVIMAGACVALSACTSAPRLATAGATNAPLEALYTVQAEGQRAVLRAITRQTSRQADCPSVAWAGGAPQPMAVRALPANVPARGEAGQADNKAAVFDVLTCEATWPQGASSARVAGQELAAPKANINRIVVIADTGCRMKGAENAFQPCNDPVAWPFAQVAQSAALTKPDLVIHIGDMHYRESPCPAGNTGCAGSPWGYGFDAWQADFFVPAKPLLAAAPWVFVRPATAARR